MMNRIHWGMALMALCFVSSATAQQRADALFETAARKERVEGDLRGAIEQYRRIATQFAKDPEAAAKALVLMGQCQEKLGQAEARKSYERVVREYGSAQQYASMARNRLAALEKDARADEPSARLVWDNPIDLWGTTSGDGRYFSFTDWSTGDVAIRDLRTGQIRRVTDKQGRTKQPRAEVWGSALSPDGQRVAFIWSILEAKTEQDIELRVIGADGRNENLLRTSDGVMEVHSWSPDGKWIAVSVAEGEPAKRRTRVLLVAADSGEVKELPVRNPMVKLGIAFSPDGKWLAYSTGRPYDGSKPGLYSLSADGSAEETLLADEARIAGWFPDGNAVIFSRNRGGTKQLFYLPVANGKAAGAERLLPVAYAGDAPMGVTRQGTMLYANHNAEFDALIWEMDPVTGKPGKIVHRIPAQSVGMVGMGGSVKFAPDGKRFLCTVVPNGILIQSVSGGTGHTLTPAMKQMRHVEWAPDGAAVLISGTANDDKDGIYRVDATSGAISLVADLKPVPVFAPSPDGKSIYYRTADGKLAVRDLSNGADRIAVGDNPYATVTFRFSRDGRKLVMGGGKYLGVLDIARGSVQTLYREERLSETLSVIGADLNPDGSAVLAIMRGVEDAPPELWRFSLAGGSIEKMRMEEGATGRLNISPDGRLAGSTRRSSHRQLWALENFLPRR